MFQDSISIFAILCLNIALAEWLTTKPYFRHVGSALLVIIITAVVANVGIIPSSSPATPLYDTVFSTIAPLSIFLMLLNVNLRSLKQAGSPMLLMFGIGSLASMAGAVVAIGVLNGRAEIGDLFYAIGGMYTGTYTGGSINFNAVALNYGVSQQGDLFAAATVADNIIGSLWIIATLALPQILNRWFPPKKRRAATTTVATTPAASLGDTESINPFDLALILLLGLAGIQVSDWLNSQFPPIPSIIWLTTIATILAQIPAINRLKGHKMLGLFTVYLFLAVIGAYCDVPALLKDGQLALTLLTLVTILIAVHGLIIYGVGALLKQDWDLISIASQANVGGASTAMALSRSLNRSDLTLPGILVGTLGSATGTYLGILVAEFLRQSGWF
jgi:uncharacterized membrane protein